MKATVGIRNVKYKPLSLLDIQAMRDITIVNCRGLRATINHLSAMVHGLDSKKDEVSRNRYKTTIAQAHNKLQQEQYWFAFYTKVLNKRNGKI